MAKEKNDIVYSMRLSKDKDDDLVQQIPALIHALKGPSGTFKDLFKAMLSTCQNNGCYILEHEDVLAYNQYLIAQRNVAAAPRTEAPPKEQGQEPTDQPEN